MSSVLDIVMQQIQAGGIQQMSQSLGLGEDEVTNVVRHVRARLESSDWQRLIGKLSQPKTITRCNI